MQDIRKQMEDGALHPGDRLASVVDLAVRYGVGRSTVREALSSLKALGLLDIRQGGGTFVRNQPAPELQGDEAEAWMRRSESLRHIVEVRNVLETGAASLAARHRTESDLTQLQATLDGMAAHLDDETYGEQADVRFHLQIAAATHNPVIADLMESLSGRLHDSMRDTRALWFYSQRSSSERLLGEHAAIAAAIRDSRPEEAGRLMSQHITKMAQVLDEKGARL
ncbi:FadR family transcriptional regulator [Paenibacillus sp. IB182496]|uniref:FadR family transcriptional regulator n=2 Tax=Paenibacillus sabuli TaxID=2772509 RepID=A0A927BX44_9BACL|nr:FadR family transcriptional regulator [Paenibacillus sabuli]